MAGEELTEERIRFVVGEHGRLGRKLKRMPGGQTMLPVDRLPDLPAGETMLDVVRGNMPTDVRAVFEATEALQPEYIRITQLFVHVTLTAGMSTPPPLVGVHPLPTAAELRAVAATADDIARSSPMLRRMHERAKKR